jgi:hypothetical protein
MSQLEQVSFEQIEIGAAADTFGGGVGEGNAQASEVYGYAFIARKPT